MQIEPGRIYHLVNSGMSDEIIFREIKDYQAFLSLYKKYIPRVASTVAWCLLPDQFHFIIQSDQRSCARSIRGDKTRNGLTDNFCKLINAYTRFYNSQYRKAGPIFPSTVPTKCRGVVCRHPVLNLHPGNCFHHLHQSPLRTKLVARLEDWEYSSFREYAGFTVNAICDHDLATAFFGYHKHSFIRTCYEGIEETCIEHFL